MNPGERIARNFHSPERGIDIPMLRHELEDAAGLTMMDLTHEMVCQREEMPALHFWIGTEGPTAWQVGRLMATCFEAGRRYGLLHAIELYSDDLTDAESDPNKRQQAKYGQVSTFEQAQSLNDFERVFDETMADIKREFPAAFEGENRSAARLMRLKREQPAIYELLRDAVRAERASVNPVTLTDQPMMGLDEHRTDDEGDGIVRQGIQGEYPFGKEHGGFYIPGVDATV